MEPIIQAVLIGPDGSTESSFTHPFRGEITVTVEVSDENGEYTAERKHMMD
jgi:hypothetical protein